MSNDNLDRKKVWRAYCKTCYFQLSNFLLSYDAAVLAAQRHFQFHKGHDTHVNLMEEGDKRDQRGS